MSRLTSWSLRRPWLVVLLAAALVTWCAVAAMRLPTAIGVESALGPHHARIQEFHAFIERYGAGHAILLAWSCGRVADCDGVLDEISLRAVARVGRALEPSPGVIRVESPVTTPLLVGDPGLGFSRRWLFDGEEPAPDRAALATLALADPGWVGRLVSADGRTGVMVIETASSETASMQAATRAVARAVADLRARGFEAHAIGQPVVEEALAVGAARDGSLLSVAVALILALVIQGLTRSWVAVLAVIASVGVGAASCFGWMALLGMPRDPISAAAPMLVMVIGSASGLHLFCAAIAARGAGCSREAALRAAARCQALPCLLATLTTAGALASYCVGDVAALVRLGSMMAVGVGVAFLACFTLLPALVLLLPDASPRALATSREWTPTLRSLSEFTARRRGVIVAGAAGLAVLALGGLLRVAPGGDGKTYLHAGHPVRVADRFVGTLVRPSDSLELELVLPQGRTLSDPGMLSALRRIEQGLVARRWLGEPDSILVPLRQLDAHLGGEPARGGDDPRAIAERLMLLSMGDPAGRETLLSFDERRARLSVPVRETGKATPAELRRLREELRAGLPGGSELLFTGPLVLAQFQLDLTMRSMATSLLLAVAFVFGALWATLRSLRWALLAMVPNLWPLLMLAGAMGWLGIPFDAASASVGTMALGLAVDDTLHLLVAFRRRRGGSASAVDAMRGAIQEVGRAVITTSFAFGLGFLALLPSSFAGVANMGLLSSLAVFSALAADLLLLPALVHLGVGGRLRTTRRATRTPLARESP